MSRRLTLAAALLGVQACARSAPSNVPAQPVPNEARTQPSAAAPLLDASALAAATSWQYRAPAECPAERRFFTELAARAKVRHQADVVSALGPEVELELEGGSAPGWVGRVTFERSGAERVREVRGGDCVEVVVALALITSLWLRPDRDAAEPLPPAQLAPERPGPRLADDLAVPSRGLDDTPGPASRRGQLLPPARSDALGPERAAKAAAGRSSQQDGAASMTGTAHPAIGTRLQVSALALVGVASEPSTALTGRMQLELSPAAAPRGWLLGAALGYALGQATSERSGSATLQLFHVQLQACPAGFEPADGSWVRVCAHGRAGVLRFGAPRDRLLDARSVFRPWLGAGPGLSVGFAVAPAWTLRGSAELTFALVRDDFVIARGSGQSPNSATFFETDPVSLELSLGASYAF